MTKRPKSVNEEFVSGVPPKKAKFAQLTSNPTDLNFFLRQIEESNEDIIKEYLSESTGEELISLLETGFDRKSNELAVIFKVLATIIIRTRKDLKEVYGEVGRRLAEGVLEDTPLSFCFRALKPQGSAEAAKASLQLLSAVVSADPLLLGRSLLRSVNFEHPDWIQVARRRNTKDVNDVRTCFINFVASFLFSDNNLLIREVLEAKNAISLLLNGCFTDKTENVLLILNLLRKSVCENVTVSKTIKMRIFTRNVLKQLGYLYAYRGEALSEKAALARTDAEVDIQTVELVRESVHSLLTPLVSSSVQGLVFRERGSLDIGGKQNEHLLNFLLSPPMENPFTDNMRRQLVLDCLLACPSLFIPYMAHLSTSMTPRDTENWHHVMMFVNQLFEAFQPHLIARFSQLMELSQDMYQFVQSVVDLCLPPKCIVEVLDKASQHESASVSKTANPIYKTLKQNMRIFLTWLLTTEELKAKGSSAQPIIDSISEILPERIANDKWCKKFRKILLKEQTDLSILKSQILPTTYDQTEDEVVEEVEEQPEVSRLPQVEEVILAQSKKLRSCFEEIQSIVNDSNVKMSEECEKKLVKRWSDFTAACLNVSRNSITLFNHLATALRVFAKKYWQEGCDELTPTPKDVLIKIGSTAVFKSILFEKPIFEQVEGNEQISIPSLPLKVAFLNLLLALAEVDPKSTAGNVPTAALLASYKASLSLCGKVAAFFLNPHFSLDRLCLQLLNLLDQSGHSPAITWGMTNRSVLWGSRMMDNYLFGSTLAEAPQLRREPTPGAFLSILDADKLLSCALKFPVTRRCLVCSPIENREE
ncbi:unnamed protein product [Rodentolepis nana]|uniref:Npa1 domain-containing protein n=1 Tax=Rodentolepis nana TaxID=102285 RepID=A0A0R3TBA8_RODNA|nr:unnamed protein product [Rodentolepis nana]